MININFHQALTDSLGSEVELKTAQHVAGGDINEAFCLDTSAGKYFAKVNRLKDYPGMFTAEKNGLEGLSESGFRIPKVIDCLEQGDYQILLLEWIESGQRGVSFWEKFAQSLNSLHQLTNDHFGLIHDNYIGTIPQANHLMSSWPDFFVEQRIMPLLHKIRDAKILDAHELRGVESVIHRLQSFFPKEPPALLHGDLWAGNFMIDELGDPVVIDPAIYYGHRYMDLGMMQLFGGFDESVFKAYHEFYPLDSEWRQGVRVANLYPLLVHVLLFGRSYWSRVESLMRGL